MENLEDTEEYPMRHMFYVLRTLEHITPKTKLRLDDYIIALPVDPKEYPDYNPDPDEYMQRWIKEHGFQF